MCEDQGRQRDPSRLPYPAQLQKDRPPLGWSSPGSVFSEDRGPGYGSTKLGFMMQLCRLAALVTFVNGKDT